MVQLKGLRVLFAEDEAPLRDVVCEWLREDGFEVVPTTNGREALEAARQSGPYHLLLFDEDMPGLKGSEVLAQLRADSVVAPALLYSGKLVLTEEECARLKVTAVLRKPLPLSDLATAIRRAIERPGGY
jgi:CheY-like chemotaxis protein